MKIFLFAVLCVQVLGLPSHDPAAPVFRTAVGPRMTLTPGDLKRFSGHTLKLLQTKCPKVSGSVIFELNKFIGKAIAKDTNPVPGDDAVFREIIKSVTTCSTSDVPKVKSEAEDESPEFFFFPHPNPITTNIKGGSDAKEEDKMLTKTKGLIDEEPTVKKESDVTPVTIAKDSTRQEKKHPFVVWISSVISSVNEFFRSFFGTRHRRSVPEEEVPAPNKSEMHQGRADDETTTGKATFSKLFDKICQIYCDKCHSSLLSRHQFKTAAKELLDHIFKIVPKEGLELAATHHLTKEFMQTVSECE